MASKSTDNKSEYLDALSYEKDLVEDILNSLSDNDTYLKKIFTVYRSNLEALLDILNNEELNGVVANLYKLLLLENSGDIGYNLSELLKRKDDRISDRGRDLIKKFMEDSIILSKDKNSSKESLERHQAINRLKLEAIDQINKSPDASLVDYAKFNISKDKIINNKSYDPNTSIIIEQIKFIYDEIKGIKDHRDSMSNSNQYKDEEASMIVARLILLARRRGIELLFSNISYEELKEISKAYVLFPLVVSDNTDADSNKIDRALNAVRAELQSRSIITVFKEYERLIAYYGSYKNEGIIPSSFVDQLSDYNGSYIKKISGLISNANKTASYKRYIKDLLDIYKLHKSLQKDLNNLNKMHLSSPIRDESIDTKKIEYSKAILDKIDEIRSKLDEFTLNLSSSYIEASINNSKDKLEMLDLIYDILINNPLISSSSIDHISRTLVFRFIGISKEQPDKRDEVELKKLNLIIKDSISRYTNPYRIEIEFLIRLFNKEDLELI